ncbi:hypothetical protein [Glutamicibacter sp. NPDC087344]|uniref:hypothetical protein n=1 Tax=Glutamicibacter sp. NPDC087344 TaxID=3363994 RepID=UPI003826A66E
MAASKDTAHAETPPADVVPDVDEPLDESSDDAPQKPARSATVLLLLSCLALNLFGYWVVSQTGFPLYLDMIGTAVVAIFIGPWSGAAVGLLTNILGLGITGESSAAFGLVNVAGALVWGYGVRSIKAGNIIPKFALLNVAVAFTCSLVASILLLFVFGGSTGHGSETTMNLLFEKTHSLGLAVFNTNIMYSLVDKILTGVIAISLIGTLKNRHHSSVYQGIEAEVHTFLAHRGGGCAAVLGPLPQKTLRKLL